MIFRRIIEKKTWVLADYAHIYIKRVTVIKKAIRMLKEASGYETYPSGYLDEASGCLCLLDPETSEQRCHERK